MSILDSLADALTSRKVPGLHAPLAGYRAGMRPPADEGVAAYDPHTQANEQRIGKFRLFQ